MADYRTRIQQKHDVEANWEKAKNFTPLTGELIIYDVDASHSKIRAKIGDGVNLLADLPWAVDEELIDNRITAEVTALSNAIAASGTVWVGTLAQYKVANDANEIATGTVVIITDDNNAAAGGDNTTGTTIAKLGTAVLGYMVLGQE